ncbi:hypothetical protein [Terriglobus roseus]|uniref:Uncharacterized protein n=1 Tax=Terriglobus roseus TaxID=392734 RepID=A0A1H4U3E2_9BACT|nr:hypothetical protein [Terriglobus roseus]SEC63212.1 hypothetical protein SAMN05443244_3943 [Terriglobus roseus]
MAVVTNNTLRTLILGLAASAYLSIPGSAQVGAGGRFDLTGPKIDVHVQRGDQSLPIAMVPNLQAGDKLTIHANLPSTQSVKLVMVIAFLRGSTNPPPENWFTRVNTWDKKTSAEGVTITVPAEAQQALIFLAPETGGDYSTLKSAVTGRPGLFVRAAQDLIEASFEQARIERYLQAIRRVPVGSPAELSDHSHKLAATLNLKPNEDCFKKEPDQQMACLRQTGTQLLMDDGHGQTLASLLTNGDSANLIGAMAASPVANSGGAGLYSAYVGTVIDLVRLMNGIHTAQFQYIPAIAFPDGETLNLRLNTPPSFHNPKSVIVVALPAIQPSVAPPLRLQDAAHVSCLLQPSMVLPLEGAPLVFATGFAHDLVLHLNNGATFNGKTDLPLAPDAFEGGLILTNGHERKPLAVAAPEARDSAENPTGMPAAAANRAAAENSVHAPAALETVASDTTGDLQITGTLRGAWGFDSFTGVTVPLQRRVGGGWNAATHNDLFAGRSNQLTLRADGTACASAVDLDQAGHGTPLQWKQNSRHDAAGPQGLEVKLPLEKSAPGNVSLLVHQFGTSKVEKVAVTAYSDATRPQALHIHAGDNYAMLSGSGLGEVKTVHLAGAEYKPTEEQPANGKDLRLATSKASKAKTPLSTVGESGTADVFLADGRILPVPFTVDAARPSLNLLSKSIKPESQSGLPLALGSKDDLPLNAKITIALRSDFPARFPRSEKVEVALEDGSLKTTLSLNDGSLVLQDNHTALAFLSPAKAFGTSAFGPLQLRALSDDGTVGDWIPLGTLVRTPTITSISCTKPAPRVSERAAERSAEKQVEHATEEAPLVDSGCQMTGSDLFLVDSVAADSTFTAPAEVPLGFAGESLPVPRPVDNHTLFLKLRDNPSAVTTVVAGSALAGGSRHVASALAPAATSGNPPSAVAPTESPAGGNSH